MISDYGNIGFDYFRDKIHGTYLRWLFKSLSPLEYDYLKSLRDGLNDMLLESIIFTDDYMSELKRISVDDFDDYFWDSSLVQDILITILGRNVDAAVKPLNRFYSNGALIACKELNVSPGFHHTDKEALAILNNYVGGVVKGINLDLINGVHDCFKKNIIDGTFDRINDDLSVLMYVNNPGVNRFSVDTRCLFTARTEYARCVNTGLLQTYSNYGCDSFDWVTSGSGVTCDKCLFLERDGPYCLDDLLSIGCPHPNCDCSFKVSDNSDDGGGVLFSRVVDLTPK